MRQIQNVITQFIGEIKYRGHGNGIGNPYQYDRKGEIDAEFDSGQRGHDHMPGNRKKGDKQAGGDATGDGTPGKMENVGVMENVTEDLEVFMFPDFVYFRQYPFKKFSQCHNFGFI